MNFRLIDHRLIISSKVLHFLTISSINLNLELTMKDSSFYFCLYCLERVPAVATWHRAVEVDGTIGIGGDEPV